MSSDSQETTDENSRFGWVLVSVLQFIQIMLIISLACDK